MKSNLIVFRNTYLDVYEKPMVVSGDTNDIVENYRRAVYVDPGKAMENHIDEMEIRLLGTFDDVTGQIDLCEQKVLVAGASLFPAGYLAKHVREY